MQVFLQPFGQIFITGVNGYTVDGTRVDHHSQCTCEGCGLEGLEIFLTEHQRRKVGRRTILTRPGGTIGEIVFGTGTYMILVDVVGVVALIAFDFCHDHLGVDNGIFTETFPDTGPTGVATEIDHRVINPGTVGSPTLIGSNFSTNASQFGIKGGSDIDGLWE